MKGRIARYEMPHLVLVAVVSLAVAGCQGGGNAGPGGGSAIEFTPAAIKSLPSVRSSGTGLAFARPAALAVSDYFTIAQLFAMQCRHPDWGGVDYCPPGTPPPPTDGTFDPYQFTMQALIGFIFHAQGYTELVTDCSGHDFAPETVTPGLYSAASTAGGANPTRFVLDQFSSYTCRASNVSNENAETRVVSVAADGSFQTTLHTRYQYDAGDGRPQTDLFQVDVSMNAGTPEFLALNFASAAPWRSRIVLLANLATHQFALKYYTPSQPGSPGMTAPERYAVAVGAGGYDLTTGAANQGHYFIDFLDEAITGEVVACVNNLNGEFLPDSTSCAADGVPMGWTSSDAVKTYLAVPASHAVRLAPFLAEFETAATLTAADAWQSVGDEDLYWPASLH